MLIADLWDSIVKILGYTLIGTCAANPESYSIFSDVDGFVGDVKFMNCEFTAFFFDGDKDTNVYKADTEWITLPTEDERIHLLEEGVKAIADKHQSLPPRLQP